MYQCGAKLPRGASFCPSCGARFTTEVKSLRNATLLAAIPGILLGILGLGHIYLGRVKRGVAFMVPGILLNIVMWIAYFQAPESAGGPLIVFILVWVAHVLDVRRLWRRG
jgi:predicted nucleic acid-binding Zn ribbon protein